MYFGWTLANSSAEVEFRLRKFDVFNSLNSWMKMFVFFFNDSMQKEPTKSKRKVRPMYIPFYLDGLWNYWIKIT